MNRNELLKQHKGQLLSFIATAERFGASNEGHNSTILLKDVICTTYPEVTFDHIWQKLSRFPVIKEGQLGTQITFQGRVVKVEKGYCGYDMFAAMENPYRKEYTIMCDLNEDYVLSRSGDIFFHFRPEPHDFYNRPIRTLFFKESPLKSNKYSWRSVVTNSDLTVDVVVIAGQEFIKSVKGYGEVFDPNNFILVKNKRFYRLNMIHFVDYNI